MPPVIQELAEPVPQDYAESVRYETRVNVAF